MLTDITVITSVTGNKDDLRDKQVKGGAQFIAYVDRPQSSSTWEMKKAYDKFTDPRRNSRIHKLLAHQYVDTKYSIWIDGNISLLKKPEWLIDTYLKDHDIALFKHPKRDCIYGEATKCATAKLDDPEVIIEQASTYEKAGYAKNKGLCECMFIIRRHTPKVRALEDCWWSEYSRHSCRDQISFMYAVDRVGIRLNVIDEPWMLAMDGLTANRNCIEIAPHIILNSQAN